MALRERIKWWLYPGLNLHARLRWRVLPGRFGSAGPGEERRILDAGCGNGMLAYQSYLRGNRVLGISIKDAEVARCRKLFHDYLQVPEDRLSFRVVNLYEAEELEPGFDEIICTEVMEHIVDDTAVCRLFSRLLNPGGTLHLCSPNADHPDNQASELDKDEAGGHVRNGYTWESYERLLTPLGFRIEERVGLGGPLRQAFNKRIIRGESAFGLPAAFALFLFALPWLPLDPKQPPRPYSLYVRAVKESP